MSVIENAVHKMSLYTDRVHPFVVDNWRTTMKKIPKAVYFTHGDFSRRTWGIVLGNWLFISAIFYVAVTTPHPIVLAAAIILLVVRHLDATDPDVTEENNDE